MVQSAFRSEKWKTNFAACIQFLSYGKTENTDASGNMLGEFSPTEYVIQLQASRSYERLWHYGLSLKYIHSSYGRYSSSGIAADFGLNLLTENKKTQLGLCLKNMGVQLKSYTNNFEDLPFDLQIGVSQKLNNLPLQLSLTAHSLHRFDLSYDDPVNEVGKKYKIL